MSDDAVPLQYSHVANFMAGDDLSDDTASLQYSHVSNFMAGGDLSDDAVSLQYSHVANFMFLRPSCQIYDVHLLVPALIHIYHLARDVPVSYTHLDVYKRQMYIFGIITPMMATNSETIFKTRSYPVILR
ncbi:MAG: hypothetical protein C4K58_08625 [Flavobacteriaceae bacterium]|nr:MAG: hypothetical protein C4K58_08625 [Flavobacteriaceae bacterium]